MDHGLNNNILYTAHKVTSQFENGSGNVITVLGTAFFIQTQTGHMCLVTNRHVVDLHYPSYNTCYPGYTLKRFSVRGRRENGQMLPVAFTEFTVANCSTFVFSPIFENDIACLVNPEIETADDQPAVIDFFLKQELVATTDDFVTKLSVCDFVAFPGYPQWHDKLNERPILRTGAIASDPRSDYAYGDSYKGQCVAYEAFSFGGSSGSPVFALRKGIKTGPGFNNPAFRDFMLVGINAGHLKAEKDQHSGISYFYKSSAILDTIAQKAPSPLAVVQPAKHFTSP